MKVMSLIYTFKSVLIKTNICIFMYTHYFLHNKIANIYLKFSVFLSFSLGTSLCKSFLKWQKKNNETELSEINREPHSETFRFLLLFYY